MGWGLTLVVRRKRPGLGPVICCLQYFSIFSVLLARWPPGFCTKMLARQVALVGKCSRKFLPVHLQMGHLAVGLDAVTSGASSGMPTCC